MKIYEKILVLSGGAIKGAYQAGMLKALAQTGYEPDAVIGISVGSINSVWIAVETSKGKSFLEATNNLVDFYKNNIKSPDDIIKKKSIFRLLKDRFFGGNASLFDTTPLKNKITKKLKEVESIHDGIEIYMGATNLSSGDITYFSSKKILHNQIVDVAMASSAIPVIMPPVEINGSMFVDGGLIDIAPTKFGIELGSKEMVVLSTHPDNPSLKYYNKSDMIQILTRTVDIMSNNTLSNDIKDIFSVNNMVMNGVEPSKRVIEVEYFRPCEEIDVDIKNFNSDDIKDMIELGYSTVIEQKTYNHG